MLINQLTQQSWILFELQYKLVCITPCYAIFLSGIIQLVFADQDIVNQRYLLVEREGVSKLALRLMWHFEYVLHLILARAALVHPSRQRLRGRQVLFVITLGSSWAHG